MSMRYQQGFVNNSNDALSYVSKARLLSVNGKSIEATLDFLMNLFQECLLKYHGAFLMNNSVVKNTTNTKSLTDLSS